MICKKCGAHNPDDSKFCSACGSLIEAETGFCIICGEKLSPDSSFCPKCGKPISNSVENTENGAGKLRGAYWTSVLSTIAVLILRLSLQDNYATRTIWNNTYYIGIAEDNVKLFLSAIPIISFSISALLANSSRAAKEKKIKAIIISGIMIVLMLLLIWVSIPERLL